MADSQFSHNFIFTNGSAKSLCEHYSKRAKYHMITGNYFFVGLNFMNNKHPEIHRIYIPRKTNYTVTCYYEALNRIHNGYTDKQMYEEFTLYDDTP